MYTTKQDATQREIVIIKNVLVMKRNAWIVIGSIKECFDINSLFF
jgi:hypothetical protein